MYKYVEDYLTLSVTDCKRLGFFQPNTVCSGSLKWNRNGSQVAAVGFATDTRGVPVAKLSYTYNGEPMEYTVYLRYKHSNLDHERGYYYFVCPVTGRLCRKLYLDNGRFVSRHALNAVYSKQADSKTTRNWFYKVIEAETRLDELLNQTHRRQTYRGKITPYGKRVAKVKQVIRRYGKQFYGTEPTVLL